MNLQSGKVEVSTGQDINYAALLYVWNNGSVTEKVAICQRLLNNKTGREITHPWVDLFTPVRQYERFTNRDPLWLANRIPFPID
jgi:hypothetical protein